MNILYSHVPTELDANGAAAAFARSEFGDQGDAAIGEPWEILVTGNGEARPLETLNVRQACFAAVVAESYLRVSGRRMDGPLVDVCSLLPGGRSQWEDLIANRELRDLARAAFESSPTEQDIAAAKRPSLAWNETRDRLDAAYRHACGVAGL